MKINLTYSINKTFIPDFYCEVLICYGLSAKNIKSSTLFIIKNIFTSYTYNKDLNIYSLKSNTEKIKDRIKLILKIMMYMLIFIIGGALVIDGVVLLWKALIMAKEHIFSLISWIKN